MARTSGPGQGTDQLLNELISSPQRRAVVWHLTDNGGVSTFDELVDVLAEDDDRAMVAVRLYHVHLPKLEASSAIEWDTDAGEVTLTPQAHEAVDSVTTNELFPRTAGD